MICLQRHLHRPLKLIGGQWKMFVCSTRHFPPLGCHVTARDNGETGATSQQAAGMRLVIRLCSHGDQVGFDLFVYDLHSSFIYSRSTDCVYISTQWHILCPNVTFISQSMYQAYVHDMPHSIAGLPQVTKKSRKKYFFKVREKSGYFRSGQGILVKYTWSGKSQGI